MNQTGNPLSGRRAALFILTAVLERRRPLDAAVEEAFARHPPDPRDRAFARMLATTALRRLGGLDHLLTRMIAKPLPDKAVQARGLLRLGLAQILFMEVPAHAAVDTAVTLAAKARHPADRSLKNLVNAVLRRAARERDALKAELDAEPLHYLPAWLKTRWTAAYGAGRARDIVSTCLSEPPLDLSLKDPGDIGRLAAETGGRVLPTGSLRLAGTHRPEGLPGFAEGRFWVQDMAAALPARLLAPAAGETVADLCAAPGGKTLQIAAGGAHTTAVDRSAKRLERLRANLVRTALQADLVAVDAAQWRPAARPDAILLDAPCSSTGTLRRNPDVAWLKGDEDLAALTALQNKLLDHAAALLGPGGRMVYCVCSLEPEEGEAQAAGFLERHGDFERVAVTPGEIGGIEGAIDAAGDLRTLPDLLAELGGMDGFFAARLRRRG